MMKLLEIPETLGELEKTSKGAFRMVRTLKNAGLTKEGIIRSGTASRSLISLSEKGKQIVVKLRELDVTFLE